MSEKCLIPKKKDITVDDNRVIYDRVLCKKQRADENKSQPPIPKKKKKSYASKPLSKS